VPAEDVSLAPLVLLTLVAAGAAAIGLAGFRRRDIG
jgi:putative exporter of polyketide antibiotics